MVEGSRIHSWTANIGSHIPPQQFGRYLLVGAWNTLFGYGTFALLTALLAPVIPYSYVAASLISGVLNITVAYLGYKWFVFKTKGNYVREWSRCVAVYGSAIILGMVLLPIIVLVLHRSTRITASAPYVAGAILMACSTVYSFLGHKKFSFRSQT
jgi:putative flippase GtrA